MNVSAGLAESSASPEDVLFHALLQIVVLLLAARGCGALARRLHQPQVVGEMAAGIVLGPSLLGHFAPNVFHSLFPPLLFSASCHRDPGRAWSC